MSKLSEIIFKGEKHYVTSPFGSRTPIKTSAGTSSSVHRGTDYGTNGKKIPQYAIEDGVVYSVGTDSYGAKYVTIKYPRINKRFLHWHLDSITVKKGQSVSKYTKIGTTGKTGIATGIHLHLGIIDLSNNTYIDPEKYAKEYEEPKATPTKSIEEVAKEVLAGKWGNGADRKKRLEAAGYNYKEVQNKVNELSKKKTTTKYVNLNKNLTSRGVYKSTSMTPKNKLGLVKPKKFGGLSYKILEDCGNYCFKIKTDTYGLCYISGKAIYGSTVTTTPTYKNGNY